MGTAKAKPHDYVYRQLFQAQICEATNPVDLSLERLTTRFSVSCQSMSAFSNPFENGNMLKIVYPICCGLDVHKDFVFACIAITVLKLDSVFSDVFGKASSSIIGHILANPSEKISDVSAFRMKHMKATEKLRTMREHMGGLDLCKANLQSLILSTAEKYIPEIDLVCIIPDMAAFSAISVIGEIGVNMSVLPISKHLCSWAGLTPQNDQSAGKKKTTRISCAGA